MKYPGPLYIKIDVDACMVSSEHYYHSNPSYQAATQIDTVRSVNISCREVNYMPLCVERVLGEVTVSQNRGLGAYIDKSVDEGVCDRV